MNAEQLERAARHYCFVTGLNPDKLISAPTPTDGSGQTFDIYVQEVQWKSIARRIEEHHLFQQSIAEAMKAT